MVRRFLTMKKSKKRLTFATDCAGTDLASSLMARHLPGNASAENDCDPPEEPQDVYGPPMGADIEPQEVPQDVYDPFVCDGFVHVEIPPDVYGPTPDDMCD